jgi:hypothetical protein
MRKYFLTDSFVQYWKSLVLSSTRYSGINRKVVLNGLSLGHSVVLVGSKISFFFAVLLGEIAFRPHFSPCWALGPAV